MLEFSKLAISLMAPISRPLLGITLATSGAVSCVLGSLCVGGARWNIGSGASISILNEPWLPNGEFISSDIPGAHFVHNFTINSLMNLYDKSWNKQVVR